MAFESSICLIAIFISLAYFLLRKKYSFFKDNGFLHEKPEFPYGNLKNVGKKFHIAYKVKELYDRFKNESSLFGMYFFFKANVVITDLDLVKNILVKDFDAFQNRGFYFNEEDDPLTGELNILRK